jgi:hypothetical protein
VNAAIEDESVLAKLRTIENVPQGWGIKYTLRIVDVVGHRVDVELRQGTRAARIWIALPASDRPRPWLDPDDDAGADTWVEQLLLWLNEEMDTVGIGDAVAHVQGPDGVARIVADGYGFRVADVAEHQRLRRAVGPYGWHVRMSKSARRRAYELADALDQADD